jgi:hypothetical protein
LFCAVTRFDSTDGIPTLFDFRQGVNVSLPSNQHHLFLNLMSTPNAVLIVALLR